MNTKTNSGGKQKALNQKVSFVVALVFTIASCGGSSSGGEKDLAVRNAQATAFGNNTQTPGSATYRIKPELTLAIPPEYRPFGSGSKSDKDSTADGIADPFEAVFSFYLPDYSGSKQGTPRAEFDDDRVKVIRITSASMDEALPDATGAFPPNMAKRVAAHHPRVNDFSDIGLTCFGVERSHSLSFDDCYGDSDAARPIALMITVPPYVDAKFPQMQARYFTTAYGGLEVVWRTNAKHASEWKNIDAHVWLFIQAWKTQQNSGAGA